MNDETLLERYQREERMSAYTECRLPYDCCRCEGKNCDRRDHCLRYVALSDMGPRTPIMARCCSEIGRESEAFIAIREEVAQ